MLHFSTLKNNTISPQPLVNMIKINLTQLCRLNHEQRISLLHRQVAVRCVIYQGLVFSSMVSDLKIDYKLDEQNHTVSLTLQNESWQLPMDQPLAVTGCCNFVIHACNTKFNEQFQIALIGGGH